MDEPTQAGHGAATIRQLSELPSTDNRRQHSRFAAELEVSVSSDHNFYTGWSENLSEGGVFVATHSLKAVGSIVELTIALPGTGQSVQVRGEVRWVRVYHERSDVPPGIGVRFLDLSPVAAQLIHAFLEHREPLFYDDE